MAYFDVPDMEPQEFSLWQSLLDERTGLWLPESRKIFLTAALVRYIKDKKLSGYKALYSKLKKGDLTVLDWASLVDTLTVHETCYYREKNAIQFAVDYCKSKAIDGFKQQPDEPQHIQIWSVGCSTGEEVYTLAIEMDKLSYSLEESHGKKIYFGVTGVDISYPSLNVASEGRYSSKQLDSLPDAVVRCYFDKLEDDVYQVSDNIKRRTCFIQGNVFDMGKKIKQKFDVIFCQNVLIYFRNERKQQVVKQLKERLKPGGVLILGHGEVTSIEADDLKKVDNKLCLAYEYVGKA